MIGLEHTADVGRFVFIQEELRTGSVVIPPIATLEEFHCDESIEKISRRSRMEPQPSPQCFEILRIFGQLSEHLPLCGTQQGFWLFRFSQGFANSLDTLAQLKHF